MGTERFERLERARPKEPDSASRPSPLEARFSGSTRERTMAPARSGADAARFEEAARSGIRVLDTDRGQAFVRCARCHADSHVAATRCAQCEASLETKEQRAFNEALFEKLRAEKEEEDREVQGLREKQTRAHAEQAAAMSQRRAMEAELRRRRELGLPLDDVDDVSDPLRTGGRALGRFVGQTLVRLLPNRPARLLALGAMGLGVLALLAARPGLLWVIVWMALVFGGLARRYRR